MRFGHPLEARPKTIKAATALTLDEAVLTPHRLQALVLVDQLRATLQAIQCFDGEIAALASRRADYALLNALPGASPQLAHRPLVAFGEQRERFRNAAKLQKYSSVAPVTERSGKKHWVHWRWRCSTFLWQTFVK